MLSYDNLVISSQNANKFDNFDESDEIIAYLPLAWVGDHIFSYGQSMTAGYCVCCPESPDTVTENRREIAPTYFFAPPRVFEGLLTEVTVRMEDASPLKQYLFNYFLDVAKRVGEPILNGETVSLVDRIKYKIGEFLVYGPLKNRYGLSKVRIGYTAGEAIGPEIFKYLPGARDEPETALRTDRGCCLHYRPARWRDLCRHCRNTDGRRRDQGG